MIQLFCCWVHGIIVPNEKLAQNVYLSIIFQRNLWSRFCVSDFVKYSLKRQSIAKSDVLKATVGRTVSMWLYPYYEHWFQPRNTFCQERQEWTQYPWGPSVPRWSYNALHFCFVNRNNQDSEKKTIKLFNLQVLSKERDRTKDDGGMERATSFCLIITLMSTWFFCVEGKH